MRASKEKLVALANTWQVHLGFRVACGHVNVKARGKMTNDFEGVHLAIKLLLSMYPPTPPPSVRQKELRGKRHSKANLIK